MVTPGPCGHFKNLAILPALKQCGKGISRGLTRPVIKEVLTLTRSSWREDCVWGCSWWSSLLRLSSVCPALCQVTSSCSPWGGVTGAPPAPPHLGQGLPLQGSLLAEVVEEALPLGAAEGLA